jgi:hypothetical protein
VIYKHFFTSVVLLLFALIFSAPLVSKASCLPEFEISATEKTCSYGADCVRVGDACRSCGAAHYANKKFKSVIESRDNKAREATKCVLACESCAKWPAQGVCNAGECAAPTLKQ